jgi:hypothetical protein
MCATCATVTSRRDYMRLMCILVEIQSIISSRILFPHRRRIVSTKSSNNNDAGRDDADQSKNCHPITSKVVSINHCSRRENGFCYECRITGLEQEVYGCCASFRIGYRVWGMIPLSFHFVSDEFTIQLIQIKVSDSQSSPSNALLNES